MDHGAKCPQPETRLVVLATYCRNCSRWQFELRWQHSSPSSPNGWRTDDAEWYVHRHEDDEHGLAPFPMREVLSDVQRRELECEAGVQRLF